MDERWGSCKGLTKLSIGLLLVLSVLALSSAALPAANAQYDLYCNPTQGAPGTAVHIMAAGFKGEVTISIASRVLAKTNPTGMFQQVSTVAMVPNVPAGTYMIQCVDAEGHIGTTSFTVLSTNPANPTPTPTPAPSGSSGGSQTPKPSTTPKKTATASPKPTTEDVFWSAPLIISIIAVAAVAILVPTFFIVRRRGGKEVPFEEEKPTYKPEPYPPQRSPPQPSRYTTNPYSYGSKPSPYARQTSYSYGHQLSRPGTATQPARSSPSATYAKPQQGFMKMCPRCKRMIRDDYNLCPYCDKKLR